MPATTADIVVPAGARLATAAGLLAVSLGFAPADAVPAWLMRTTGECGGLTLAALDGDDVVGVSYALPALDGPRRAWFSCGLAVAPAARGRGIARALKLEQRNRALAAGVEVIRWTVDARNAPALRLYLSTLGARLVGYGPGRHRGLRTPGAPDDDVDVEWRLAGAAEVDGATRAVALPPAGDEAAHAAYARSLRAALDDGLVGVALDLDGDGRAWLRLARERPA